VIFFKSAVGLTPRQDTKKRHLIDNI